MKEFAKLREKGRRERRTEEEEEKKRERSGRL